MGGAQQWTMCYCDLIRPQGLGRTRRLVRLLSLLSGDADMQIDYNILDEASNFLGPPVYTRVQE